MMDEAFHLSASCYLLTDPPALQEGPFSGAYARLTPM